MQSRHVAFCLDQAYGNIIPTLGIAMGLLECGHRVSYTVTRPYAQAIHRIGAQAIVIEPLDIRGRLLEETILANDCSRFAKDEQAVAAIYRSLSTERTRHLLGQFETQFEHDRPDVILHDDSLDTAGRDYAKKWNIARIRHHSQFIDADRDEEWIDFFAEDDLVLMTVPEFFQRRRDSLDARFHFVGFIPEGRTALFDPWEPPVTPNRPILISATTGLLPQGEFYERAIEAACEQPWSVILSLSGTRDRISALDPANIGKLPNNIYVNSTGSNFDLLRHCRLYVGQGGQGGALEAIYWGVPQIIIPPEPYHYSVARRVAELELGTCLPPSKATGETLRSGIAALLDDPHTLARVSAAGEQMRQHRGKSMAVELIEGYLGRGRPI